MRARGPDRIFVPYLELYPGCSLCWRSNTFPCAKLSPGVIDLCRVISQNNPSITSSKVPLCSITYGTANMQNLKKNPHCSIQTELWSTSAGSSWAPWRKLAGSALLGDVHKVRQDGHKSFLKSIAPLLQWLMHLLNDMTSDTINTIQFHGLLRTQSYTLTYGFRNWGLWIYF